MVTQEEFEKEQERLYNWLDKDAAVTQQVYDLLRDNGYVSIAQVDRVLLRIQKAMRHARLQPLRFVAHEGSIEILTGENEGRN